MKTPRFLVTTSEEQTWKFDRPILFLNDGCCKHDRKHVWENLDAIVAEAYPPDKETSDLDFATVQEIKSLLFPDLCKILNELHITQYPERFWKIVLGHWFNHYVSLLVKRIRALERVLEKYEISGISTYSIDSYDLTTNQYYPSWIYSQGSSAWNNTLNLKILEELNHRCAKIEISFSPHTNDFSLQNLRTERTNWKSRIFEFLEKVTYRCRRDTDAFMVSTYLPPKELIKLSFRMGQIPQFWKTPEMNLKSEKDTELRRALSSSLQEKSDSVTVRIVKNLMFDLIPIAYLEGFKEVEAHTNGFNFPKNPRFIFTSNAFLTSDVYKFWIATKVISGTKYFVGQHGNTYLTNRWVVDTVEEVTSDKFLTWGEAIPNPTRYVPAFVFPNKPKKPLVLDSSGGLLLITCTPVGNLDDWDPEVGFVEYIEMNQEFVRNLLPVVRSKTTLRLHAGYRHLKFNELKRWQEFDSKLKIDEGFAPISSLINQNRIIVHGYDSTGILITLSQNIPTMAFWMKGFDHLREEVIADYKMLLDVGIIHLEAESASNHVNEIWNDIRGWWNLEEVQKAREIFCRKYATSSSNPSRDLSRTLKSLL